MGYFVREQLPITYAMADQYTVANHWYSSVMGPTWPNRFFLMLRKMGGYKSNQIDGDYSFETLLPPALRARYFICLLLQQHQFHDVASGSTRSRQDESF